MLDINLLVKDQRVSCEKKTLVADSRNYQYATFSFDEEWEGLIKTAIFKNGKLVYHVPLDINNRCLIPEQVLKMGVLEISVFAGDRITATSACFRVIKSGYENNDAPPPPDPDIYSTILQMVSDAVETAESVREDADAGVFKGEKGDPGEPGPPGTSGEIAIPDWLQNNPEGLGYIKNKPFYEKERIYKLDGNLAEKDSIQYGSITYYKVSDDLPTEEELNAGTVYDSNGNKQFDMSSQTPNVNETVYSDTLAGFIIVVYRVQYTMDGSTINTAPSTGIYISENHDWMELRLSNLVKTIEEKFLPEGFNDWNYLQNKPFYEKERIYRIEGSLSGRDVVVYNGTFYKVSDDLPTPDELNAGVVYDSNGNKQFDMSPETAQGNETIYIEAMAGFLIVVYDKYYNPDGLSNHEAPSTGVYLADKGLELRLNPLVKTLDEKFLPFKQAESVPEASGSTPTASEFNALLSSLRKAGILK